MYTCRFIKPHRQHLYTQEVLIVIHCLVIMHDGLRKAATSHLPSQQI